MPSDLHKNMGVITRTYAKSPGETPGVVEEINTPKTGTRRLDLWVRLLLQPRTGKAIGGHVGLVRKLVSTFLPSVYASDGLISLHRHAFMDEPQFQSAYQRGVDAIGGRDLYGWQWRVHIGLWAAASASHLDGDFVECGVNYGFLSSAIMEYLDWDRLGKTFYLLDTFAGLDPRFTTAIEREAGAITHSEEHLRDGFYASSADSVRANFAQWRNQRIIVGPVPETLDQVDARAVAFLHIDMNCAPPEVAALRYFWPRLSPGGFVLLDDYAFRGYEQQRLAMNTLAGELGVPICALPTGQGLLIKPATT